MSYLAIARKWRPTSFDTIAGQRHVTRTLANAIRMGRIHHAFLFTGPRGVGKTTAARALARALQCEKGPTSEPCGVCGLCTSILSGTCPDVIEIDGASNNSVDDVRDLRESVRYLPSMGRYRIYVIDEVHMLSRGAFNALLKTLEEPPAHVIFIFATTEVQKIPETILSRVQRFDFKRIPASVVAVRLQEICQAEGIEISAYALRLVASAGEGSMRDSQSLLDQVISFAGKQVADEQVIELLGLVDRTLLYAMLEGLIQGKPDQCLEVIDRINDYGYELTQFTTEMLELLRNAAFVVLSPDAARYVDVSGEELERLKELGKGMNAEVFTRWFDALSETHEALSRSSRPRLNLEMAVARLTSIRPSAGMDQLVSRLEDMERRLRGLRGSAPPRPGGGGPSGSQGPRPSPAPASSPVLPPRPPPSRVEAPPSRVEAPPSRVEAPPSRVEPPTRVEPSPSRVEPPSQSEAPPSTPRIEATSPLSLPTEPASARMDRVLDILQAEPGWEFFVEQCAFASESQGVLTFVVPTEMRLKTCVERLKLPRFLELVQKEFPDFRRADMQVRTAAQGSLRTRGERRLAAESERSDRARAELLAHPAVSRLKARLGAELESVILP